MTRWPIVTGFVFFVALCASAAYWAMQLFEPPARPVSAAPAPMVNREVKLDAAMNLLGGRTATAMAEHYLLKGVVVARNPRNSVAILATDGKPAQAIGVGSEVMRGVTVKEVHPRYVLLSERGIEKRVQLPETATPGGKATK